MQARNEEVEKAMSSAGPRNALRRFFSGLTEQTFGAHLGVADPALVDYISSLLDRFVRQDSIFAIRSLAGRRLVEVADMLMEADHRIGDARREVHRHIGDFTLFWTGVFPEALDRMRGAGRKDALLDYTAQGKRAYYIASTIPADREGPEPAVLHRLSHEFELCAYGLGQVRREWERHDAGPAGPGIQLLIN